MNPTETYISIFLFAFVAFVESAVYCPNSFSGKCDPLFKYQSFDGTCNNLQMPTFGSTNSAFKRFLLPQYDDKVNIPRTLSVTNKSLPNPRVISRTLSPDNLQVEEIFTHMVALFGQFIDHDITSQLGGTESNGVPPACPCDSTNPLCFSIKIPADDTQLPMSCMKFVRNAAQNVSGCSTGFREQINQLSSFIDGSDIYGSSENISLSLRQFQGGLLLTTNGVTKRKYLPQSTASCSAVNPELKCFRAGEFRTNENMGLTSIQVLFLREHNRIATELSAINPSWSDDRLYYETRRIVVAVLQHIIYREWLGTILDQNFYLAEKLAPNPTNPFLGYDPRVNPALASEFSAAAFRFGHTLIKGQYSRYFNNTRLDALNISRIILNVDEAYNTEKVGLESIMLGLINDKVGKVDTSVSDTLLNHLFEAKLPNGTFLNFPLDLPAANINRGRDHGLAPYVKFREFCGLKPVFSFADLSGEMTTETINKLSSVYENVADIDLWIGGLSEVPRNKMNLLGPTFSCIIARQFRDLRNGDRFFYDNAPNPQLKTDIPAFKLNQLNEIKRASLAGLICNNFDVDSVQRNVFYIPSDQLPL